MSSITESLLKFPSGLQLYIQHCGKRLDGIVLRPYAVFDVVTSNAENNRTGMVPNYLLNYFRRHQVIKSAGGYMTYSCNEMYIPNLLAVLFVAEGARKGSSLQEILDEKMSAEGLAQIGKGPTLEERLTKHLAAEKATKSLNTVHYPAEAAPIRVLDRIAAIEARVSSSSSSSNSSASEPPAAVPVIVRANLTYSPTPCRTCKNLSTFFVDTGGDWDCIDCIDCVKCASLTTAQRTLLERLGPDPIVKVNDSFPLKHHPFVGLYKDGIQCHSCEQTHTLVFDRLFDKPWSYCSGCAGFEIVQRSATPPVETNTTVSSTAEVLNKLKARKLAQRLELADLRAIRNITVRCKHLQGRIDHRKALISTSAEDLKKKEAALTEELAALEKVAAEVRVIRELEKRVIEARKILEEPECK